MVAVLFEWERRVSHPEIGHSEIIDDASDKDIRSFLLQLFNENHRVSGNVSNNLHQQIILRMR